MNFKSRIIAIFTLALCTQLSGQNLCTNGSFDTWTTLPNSYAQVCYANGWGSPSGICALVVGVGSPDYYHTSGTGGANSPSSFWANVLPHSNPAFQGLCAWYPGGYREYIYRQLSTPLVIGQPYTVSFWWTNAVSTIHGYGCNRLGAYFSTTAPVQSGGNVIAVTPQCESATVLFSTTWQQATFSFTPTAAFQYICIGNFSNNAATTATVFASGSSGAYYYIDDVVVSSAALPYENKTFKGKLQGNTVALSWEWETPVTPRSFSIMKGHDGNAFEKIGEVLSDPDGSYSFLDPSPFAGENYYYISSEDENLTHSNTILIENQIPFEMNYVWNADSRSLLVSSSCVNEETPAEVKIQELSGKEIARQSGQCGDVFEFSNFETADGIYLLCFLSGDYSTVRKVVLN
jgi:hypothetical protein